MEEKINIGGEKGCTVNQSGLLNKANGEIAQF